MTGRSRSVCAIACAALALAAPASGAPREAAAPRAQTIPRSAPPPGAASSAQPLPAADGRIARWRVHSREASRRFGIPLAWIEAVMRAESSGRTMLGGRPITSSAGAMGLMQLMPATWAQMRARHGLGPDPHDPRDNILAGTAYLAELYERFGYPGLLGAYNAGPQRYGDWLAGRRPLPVETRAYLARLGVWRVLAGAHRGEETRIDAAGPSADMAAPSRRRAALFALERRANAAAGEDLRARGNALFVPLSAGDAAVPAEEAGR